jgi:type II secretory pathway pseudopilin PulG
VADRGPRAAGFTILELLVVIGIVLTIGAVALPFTLREIDRRQEAETIDRLGLLVRFARAEARGSGVPVVVEVDATGTRIEARTLDPRDDDGLAAVLADTTEAAESVAQAIAGTWSRVELPDGLRCVPEPDFGELDGESAFDDPGLDALLDATPRMLDEIGPDVWPDVTRLAMFLPDGTAIATRVFGLATDRGWRRCDIDPYGGRLFVQDPMTSGDLDAEPTEAVEIDEASDRDVFSDDLLPPRDDATETSP